jgi:N-acyl-L-homoserine lactone synthetase
MLRYIYADEITKYPKLGSTMFKDRADQFRDRLGWPVQVDENGEERDEYDAMNPLYVVWEMPDGTHGGSMRTLPTTGPCMINDHFQDVTGGALVSPLIWESTRFCISPNAGLSAKRISGALMLGGCEIGLNFGLRHAVGVFDARMVRIYRALGWVPETLGTKGSGKDRISVGLWEFSDDVRQTLCQKAQIAPEDSSRWFAQLFPSQPLRTLCVA